jgi:hypothetical protein
LDIVHLNECQLVTEASDEELGLYDDEDDSNGMSWAWICTLYAYGTDEISREHRTVGFFVDENNWRNDYPDEDEWNGSSDEEPRYRNDDYGMWWLVFFW